MARNGHDLAAALRSTIVDERVLRAVAEVPRDLFVPHEQRKAAWDDEALPIAAGQTISQPTVVCRMCAISGRSKMSRPSSVPTMAGSSIASSSAILLRNRA